MRTLALALVFAATMGAQERTVTVCTEKVQSVQASYAKETASKIFGAIGVTVKWYANDRCPADGNPIRLSISQRVERDDAAHFALAVARPYEGVHVVVFYERVKHLVEPVRVHRLLAYVLVHEITHILQAVDCHADSGIMRARWSEGDLTAMRTMDLQFTADDLELIDVGLAARQARRTGVLLAGAN